VRVSLSSTEVYPVLDVEEPGPENAHYTEQAWVDVPEDLVRRYQRAVAEVDEARKALLAALPRARRPFPWRERPWPETEA
jgi:hypothetical protein